MRKYVPVKNPNFFVVGAPKCGTTTLYEWLRSHKNIYMSAVKEPHYYSKDLNLSEVATYKEYQKLFSRAQAHHVAIGEASVRYLYSDCAVKNILSEIKNPRFIVCVRNPVSMCVSLYRQECISCNEDIENFTDAWHAQKLRAIGNMIPKNCKEPKVLQYGDNCMLGRQVNRLYELCDGRNIEVVFAEDMREKPAEVYRKVMDFLEVVDDGKVYFPNKNKGGQLRSRMIGQASKRLHEMRKSCGLPPGLFGLGEMVGRVNKQNASPISLKPEMKETLQKFFEQDIYLLERITGRDLSSWRAEGY